MGDDWKKVADAVRARMDELAIGQGELARRAGISDTKVREVLRGLPLARPYMRVKLSRGLGWSNDSIDRILNDEPPIIATSMPASEADDRLDAIDGRLVRIEGMIEQLLGDSRATK